jgi:polysaccharide export outer membrane protein
MAAATISCGSLGPYVWVDDYLSHARQNEAEAYTIAPGDLVSIRVFNQEGMSAQERVRQDGKISLPFLRDVQAAGVTPNVLAELLQVRLKSYIKTPMVTVMVMETSPLALSVLGEVGHPGQYTLEKDAGVLEAVAAAGGLTDLAHRDRIFILRRRPSPVRIRMTFEALSRGQGFAAVLKLRSGDSIVVE